MQNSEPLQAENHADSTGFVCVVVQYICHITPDYIQYIVIFKLMLLVIQFSYRITESLWLFSLAMLNLSCAKMAVCLILDSCYTKIQTRVQYFLSFGGQGSCP